MGGLERTYTLSQVGRTAADYIKRLEKIALERIPASDCERCGFIFPDADLLGTVSRFCKDCAR